MLCVSVTSQHSPSKKIETGRRENRFYLKQVGWTVDEERELEMKRMGGNIPEIDLQPLCAEHPKAL